MNKSVRIIDYTRHSMVWYYHATGTFLPVYLMLDLEGRSASLIAANWDLEEEDRGPPLSSYYARKVSPGPAVVDGLAVTKWLRTQLVQDLLTRICAGHDACHGSDCSGSCGDDASRAMDELSELLHAIPTFEPVVADARDKFDSLSVEQAAQDFGVAATCMDEDLLKTAITVTRRLLHSEDVFLLDMDAYLKGVRDALHGGMSSIQG